MHFNLGFVNLAAALLTVAAIWAFRYYRIDHAEYTRTREILEARRAGEAGATGSTGAAAEGGAALRPRF